MSIHIEASGGKSRSHRAAIIILLLMVALATL
jgi:hypothetical protein